MGNVNESLWMDSIKRANSDVEKNEESAIFGMKDRKALDVYIELFAYQVLDNDSYYDLSMNDFISFVKDYSNNIKITKLNPNINNIIEYVNDEWNTINDMVERKIGELNESLWMDSIKRANSSDIKKEDKQKYEEYKGYVIWFSYSIVYKNNYKNTLDDFIKYFKELKKNSYDKNGNKSDFEHVITYISRHWSAYSIDLNNSIKKEEEEIKSKGFVRESGKSVEKTLDDWWNTLSDGDKFDILVEKEYCDWNADYEYIDLNGIWNDMTWDVQIDIYMEYKDEMVEECDSVSPNGGVVFGDISGMGPISLPGNGLPGSGDLPMPSGKVYHQVAPFTTFLKMKKKKNKKKKFRKEDEPCVHSPNKPVYNYVDDYRDYVDRTYNDVDKRK